MLGFLLKKQLSEVFKSYFYDAKKKKMRSKGAVAGMFIFFIFIMLFFAAIFAALAFSLCAALNESGVAWLYFLIMGGVSVVMGAFGSIFSTATGLYQAKDNDLLLALPIPVRTILGARVLNVYLMGALYSVAILLPTLAIYWIMAGVTALRLVCGIAFLVIITVFVLILSCTLGWAVAKISLRMKNKSFVRVAASLAFIIAYYVFYFRANEIIQDLIANAEAYGEKIRGSAYVLYRFGRIGEGDLAAAVLFLGIVALLFLIVWAVLSRTFLGIATATGNVQKTRYVEKPVHAGTVFGALVRKEFARFTSSANYMLNCGLGILLLPAAGVLLLIKGREILGVLGEVLASRPDFHAVILCAAFCMILSMIDTAAPSVSLEGRSLWIPQSLPIQPGQVLRAKAAVQLILSLIPAVFASVCAAAVLDSSPAVRIMTVVFPCVYTVFSAMYGTAVGTRLANPNWTEETTPIKQGGAVTLVLFSGWGLSIVVGGIYPLIGYRIGAAAYLGLLTVLFLGASLILRHWLERFGGQHFTELS